MSIIQGRQISQDLKFIQLKKYQLSTENHLGTGLCVTVDHRNQTIIVCCHNELIYVPLISLLNFDVWSKNFLKNVDSNTPDRIIITINQSAPFLSHLISASSKGYGSKLAVACNDCQGSSLFMLFYHLDSIYQSKQKSVYYNRFNFPISASSTKVRLLSWHPEMNDNVFACSLNDGSMYVLYISDFPQKTVTILIKIPENRHVSAFCWSPKGKQIVISFDNSFFHQFKTQFNENNLVQSTNFQESKRNQLPGDYGDFRITNIHWISTFNFFMVCRNKENNVILLMISIPSSKATGADAVMKIVDFGNLILELIDTPEPFEDYLFPLDNLILTYTNKSNDLVLVGCQNPNQLNVCENWAEITVDDDFRLMVDEFLLIRGLNFMHGTPRQIKINGFDKGGMNHPYALIYDSKGQLTLFLVDYEDAQNSTFLRVPNAPTNVIKPKMVDENNSVENLPADNLATNNPTAKAQNDQIVPKPSAANINSNFPAKPNTNSQGFFNQSTPITQPSLSSVPKATPWTIVPGSKDNNRSQDNVQIQQNKAQVPPGEQATAASATNSKDLDVDDQMKSLYVSEILSNIKEFSQHLKTQIASLKETLNRTNIGSTKDFENIKFETEFIMNMLEKLSASFSSLNHDVDDLKTSCLELEYLLEEIRSLSNRNMDPNYRYILQKKNLDPLTSRRMKEINSLRDYIEIQLRELNAKFDLEWQEWLQKMKRSLTSSFLSPASQSSSNSPYLFLQHHHSKDNSKVRSPPTSPHSSFISSSSRNKVNNDYQEYSRLDENLGLDARNVHAVIYKALVKNQKLIDNLRQQIQFLARKIALIKHNYTSSDVKSNQEDVQELSRLLDETSLNSSKQPSQTEKSVVVLQCLPARTKSSLNQFLEQRHSVPIRVCQPCSNDGDPLNEKSRFISVLEKIKEKHLKDQQKKAIFKQNSESKSKTEIKITSSTPKPSVVNVKKIEDQPKPKQQQVSQNVATQAQVSPQAKTVVVSKPQTNSLPGVRFPVTNIVDTPKPKPTDQAKSVPKPVAAEIPTFSFKLPPSKPHATTVQAKVTLPVSSIQSDQTASKPQTSKINTSGSTVLGSNVSPTTSSTSNQVTTNTEQFPVSLKTAFPTISSSLFDNQDTKSKPAVTPVFGLKKSEEKPSPPPPATTTVAAKPFNFSAAISSLASSGSSVTNVVTSTPTTSTSTANIAVATSTQQSSPPQISLKTAFPTISSSLFGNNQDKEDSKLTITPVSLKAREKSAPAPPVPATTAAQQPFSFTAAISSLAISSSGSPNVTSAPTIQTSSNQQAPQTGIFGSFSSANSAFGQAGVNTSTASTGPSLFSSTPNPLGGSVFKPCSPEQPKPAFGSFSFGGNANNTSSQSSLPAFGASPLNTSSQQSAGGNGVGGGGSIFSQLPNSSSSPFSANQPLQSTLSPPNQKPFSLFSSTTSPAFGSPNTSGGTVFGGNPVFGGSPSFGNTFGVASNLGGIMNNSMPVQSFTAINPNHTFGSMAFKNEPMPSFDSLAADNKNMAGGPSSVNNNSNNHNNFVGNNNSGSSNVGGQFFSTITPNTGAFTQRRG